MEITLIRKTAVALGVSFALAAAALGASLPADAYMPSSPENEPACAVARASVCAPAEYPDSGQVGHSNSGGDDGTNTSTSGGWP